MTDLSGVSDADLLASLPRGVRNNNPLNVEASIPWKGATGSDGRFATFATMNDGLAAADQNLQAYHAKHGINTVAGVVARWAPSKENNTAAYTRFVSQKIGVRPDQPIDLTDPETRRALLGAMAEHENGAPVVNTAPNLSDVSDADLLASLGPKAPTKPPAAPVRPPQRPAAAPKVNAAADSGLGLLSGLQKSVAGIADQVQQGPVGGVLGALRTAAGLSSMLQGHGAPVLTGPLTLNSQIADRQAYKPQTGVGKFAQTVGTMLPNAAIPGSVPQRVANVILPALGQEGGQRAAKAVGLGETGQQIAGVVGAALGGGAASLRLSPKAARLPKADLAAMKAGVKDAYADVDASGFQFPQADVSGLADSFEKTVGSSALSKSAKDDAASIISYTRDLAKGDVSLGQLEKLRGDIYAAMVKKGGDTSAVGSQFRAAIDGMIDSVDNGLVRNARQLNAQYKKAELVNRLSLSADRAAERTYGGDYGRKLKDRLNPLVDEAMPQRNLRGTTPDEKAALDLVSRGTKTQNLASAVGGMLDPRRLGGKILAGITTTAAGAGAPFSAGSSLLVPAAQIAAGVGLTAKASSIARHNLQNLLDLFAAGGVQPKAPPPITFSPNAYAGFAAPTSLLLSATPAIASARPRPKDRRP